MTTRSRLRFVRGQVAWMVGACLLLAALDALTLRLFLGASLVGLFLAVELTSPVNVEPKWRTRLRWLVVLGLLAFGLVVLRRTIAVLPEGVL